MKVKQLVLLVSILMIIGVSAFIYYYMIAKSPFSNLPLFPWEQSENDLRFLYSFGDKDGENSLRSPLSIAINDQGKCFVVDNIAGQINVYDPNGKYLYHIGKQGAKPGELTLPVGIAVDAGLIYVTEPTLGRIQVFKSNGEYSHTLLENANETPVGIRMTEEGTILYTDVRNSRIVEVDLQGNEIVTFGKAGDGEGEFQYPNDLEIDKNNRIYVSDSNNGRIQVFNRSGQYLFQFDGSSDNTQKMSLPRGLAFDRYNRLLVIDTLSNHVRVFDQANQPLFTHGQRGTEERSLQFPNGIRIDNNKIYIVDRENRRVQVFN